jgi:hypothetical protein
MDQLNMAAAAAACSAILLHMDSLDHRIYLLLKMF